MIVLGGMVSVFCVPGNSPPTTTSLTTDLHSHSPHLSIVTNSYHLYYVSHVTLSHCHTLPRCDNVTLYKSLQGPANLSIFDSPGVAQPNPARQTAGL